MIQNADKSQFLLVNRQMFMVCIWIIILLIEKAKMPYIFRQNYTKTAMVVSAVGLCHIGFVSATRNRHTCSLSRFLKLVGLIQSSAAKWTQSKKYDIKECASCGVYWVNLKFRDRYLIDSLLYTYLCIAMYSWWMYFVTGLS